MPTAATRPTIRLKVRNTAKRKVLAKAVKELVVMRKSDPAAYKELIGKYAEHPVRIVPG